MRLPQHVYTDITSRKKVLRVGAYYPPSPLICPSYVHRPDEESDSTEWETDTDASDEEEADGEQACIFNTPKKVAPFGVRGGKLYIVPDVVVPVASKRVRHLGVL